MLEGIECGSRLTATDLQDGDEHGKTINGENAVDNNQIRTYTCDSIITMKK